MKVKIKPSVHASQRTINRIRENGPEFKELRKDTQHTFAMGSVAASLLQSPNGWLGWLPRKEFEKIKG